MFIGCNNVNSYIVSALGESAITFAAQQWTLSPDAAQKIIAQAVKDKSISPVLLTEEFVDYVFRIEKEIHPIVWIDALSDSSIVYAANIWGMSKEETRARLELSIKEEQVRDNLPKDEFMEYVHAAHPELGDRTTHKELFEHLIRKQDLSNQADKILQTWGSYEEAIKFLVKTHYPFDSPASSPPHPEINHKTLFEYQVKRLGISDPNETLAKFGGNYQKAATNLGRINPSFRFEPKPTQSLSPITKEPSHPTTKQVHSYVWEGIGWLFLSFVIYSYLWQDFDIPEQDSFPFFLIAAVIAVVLMALFGLLLKAIKPITEKYIAWQWLLIIFLISSFLLSQCFR